MNKVIKIINSRIFVAMMVVLLLPFWFVYVAEKFVTKPVLRPVEPDFKQEFKAPFSSSGPVDKSMLEVAGAIRNVDLEFVKIVPGNFGRQSAIFRINNRSGYDLYSTTFNVEFFDEKGEILDVENVTKMGNEVYFNGEQQTLAFEFDPSRYSGNEKVNIGSAVTAKAKVVWAASVSPSGSAP